MKLLRVTFFAQHVHKDKTHHRNIQKISDSGVYLVLLSEFFPGSLKFCLPSAGLITDNLFKVPITMLLKSSVHEATLRQQHATATKSSDVFSKLKTILHDYI